LREEITKDVQIAKESKLKKKYDMKNMMQKQLAEVAKKQDDAYELDRLAQTDADNKNVKLDQTIIHKNLLRKDLVKQSVFGNQEILKEKQWNKSMDHRQIRQDLILTNKD